MNKEVLEKINKYIKIFPEEKDALIDLSNRAKAGEDIFDRKNLTGHVTASGLVLFEDKILLVFHKNLNKYLQSGGHVENFDKNLLAAAIREVKEETGLDNVTIHSWTKEHDCPITIDTHPIPENPNKGEGDHWHHDFMFLLTSEEKKVELNDPGISGFKWIAIDEFSEDVRNIQNAISRIKSLNIK